MAGLLGLSCGFVATWDVDALGAAVRPAQAKAVRRRPAQTSPPSGRDMPAVTTLAVRAVLTPAGFEPQPVTIEFRRSLEEPALNNDEGMNIGRTGSTSAHSRPQRSASPTHVAAITKPWWRRRHRSTRRRPSIGGA